MFEKWAQEDFVQRGVFSPLADFIKLIMKNPNKPFKKSSVDMQMKRAKVKMELKNTDWDDV